MTAPSHVPAALADVALIDAKACAAAASISVRSWYAAVAAGLAPQPVIRAPSCSRWRLADVREWLAAIAAKGVDDDLARQLSARASKAAQASSEKRRARRSEGAPA